MAAVNVPTNTKIKEQDINQKLQLYGIYSAFANGKAPSNKQIDVAMNSALASSALSAPSKKLSAEGHALIADVRDVIEKAKVLLLSKNDGNLIQDFIWQSQNFDGSNANKPNMPVDKETAKQHGNEAADGLRTLGSLLISNGQFRKLLKDATVLLRDVAGDGAQKAASKVNPSDEALNQMHDPAEENTWHENPDMSTGNIKSKLKSSYDKNKPFNSQQAKEAAQAGQETAQDQPTDQDAAAAGAVTASKSLKDKATAGIRDEHKQRAKEYANRSKDYMNKKMPKERRDQVILRLKKMVIEIQGHPDYQRAIETLLRLAETYGGHGKDLSQQSKGTMKGAHTDNSLTAAETDLKTLLERFANGSSMDDLIDSINQIYRDAEKDPDLKDWFKNVDKYIRKCLQEQGYIMQEQANTEYDQLYDKGNYLLRDRYKQHTDRIFDEFKYFGDQFDKDPQNKAFANSLNKLFKDLGTDENGKPAFKPHLLKDLSEVIIPDAFEHIRYVPIPRIEYSDPMMDAVVENLVIEGDNLAPNVMELGSDNYFRWGRKSIANKNKNKVMLSVSGIQCDLRDVSYYVNKKQGFPSVKDTGLMDIFMGGSGFSFKAALETADKTDKHHFFKINSVVVDVKNMNIKLKKSKFKLLFGLVKPLLFRVIRPVIQKVLEKQIRENITKLDAFLYEVQQEVNRAKEDAKRNPDPENIQSIYQQYATAFQKRMAEGKDKTKEAVADKKVNVAMTQHDSIFKNVKLPGGISTKATEYKELAAKGDKWESPVFSIGSAKGSSTIPKAPEILRKSGKPPTATTDAAGAVGAVGSTPTTNGTANASGFANQVDGAFANTASDAKGTGATTLGANPVVSGNA